MKPWEINWAKNDEVPERVSGPWDDFRTPPDTKKILATPAPEETWGQIHEAWKDRQPRGISRRGQPESPTPIPAVDRPSPGAAPSKVPVINTEIFAGLAEKPPEVQQQVLQALTRAFAQPDAFYDLQQAIRAAPGEFFEEAVLAFPVWAGKFVEEASTGLPRNLIWASRNIPGLKHISEAFGDPLKGTQEALERFRTRKHGASALWYKRQQESAKKISEKYGLAGEVAMATHSALLGFVENHLLMGAMGGSGIPGMGAQAPRRTSMATASFLAPHTLAKQARIAKILSNVPRALLMNMMTRQHETLGDAAKSLGATTLYYTSPIIANTLGEVFHVPSQLTPVIDTAINTTYSIALEDWMKMWHEAPGETVGEKAEAMLPQISGSMVMNVVTALGTRGWDHGVGPDPRLYELMKNPESREHLTEAVKTLKAFYDETRKMSPEERFERGAEMLGELEGHLQPIADAIQGQRGEDRPAERKIWIEGEEGPAEAEKPPETIRLTSEWDQRREDAKRRVTESKQAGEPADEAKPLSDIPKEAERPADQQIAVAEIPREEEKPTGDTRLPIEIPEEKPTTDLKEIEPQETSDRPRAREAAPKPNSQEEVKPPAEVPKEPAVPKFEAPPPKPLDPSQIEIERQKVSSRTTKDRSHFLGKATIDVSVPDKLLSEQQDRFDPDRQKVQVIAKVNEVTGEAPKQDEAVWGVWNEKTKEWIAYKAHTYQEALDLAKKYVQSSDKLVGDSKAEARELSSKEERAELADRQEQKKILEDKIREARVRFRLFTKGELEEKVGEVKDTLKAVKADHKEALAETREKGRAAMAERLEAQEAALLSVRNLIDSSFLPAKEKREILSKVPTLSQIRAYTEKSRANREKVILGAIDRAIKSIALHNAQEALADLAKSDKKMHDPFRGLAQHLLDKFTPSKPTAKSLKRATSLKNYLERIQKDNPEAYARMRLMPSEMFEDISRLEKIPLSSMETEDLRALSDYIERLQHQDTQKGILGHLTKERTYEKARDTIHDEVKNSAKPLPVEKRGRRGLLHWAAKRGVPSWFTQARAFGGTEGVLYRINKYLSWQDDKLQQQRIDNKKVHNEALLKLADDPKKAAKERQKVVTVKTSDNSSVKMTVGEYIGLLGGIDDNEGPLSTMAQAIKYGFISRKRVKGTTVPKSEQDPWIPTFEELRYIWKNAPENYKEAMTSLRGRMNADFEAFDKVHFELTGRHLDRYENRWPRLRERDITLPDRVDSRYSEIDIYRPENDGANQPRTGGNMPVVLMDAFDTYNRVAEHRSLMMTMGVPIRDAVAVLGDPKVKRMLVSRIGEDGLDQIRNTLDLQARGGNVPQKQRVEQLFRWAERSVAAAVLPFRLTTMAIQPISFIYALDDTPPDVVLAGLKAYASNPRKADKAMTTDIATAYQRYYGGSIAEVMHGVMIGDRTASKGAAERALRVSFMGDRLAMGALYQVGLAYAKSKGLTGKKAMDFGKAYWLEQLNLTQPGGAPISASGIYVESRWNPAIRPLTWLGSQKNKIANMVISRMTEAVSAYQVGDKQQKIEATKQLGKTLGVVLMGQALVSWVRRKEREKLRGADKADAETIALDTLEGLAGTIYGMDGVARGISNLAKRKRGMKGAMPTGPVGDIVETSFDAAANWVKFYDATQDEEISSEDYYKSLINASEQTLRLLGYKFGLPTAPMEYASIAARKKVERDKEKAQDEIYDAARKRYLERAARFPRRRKLVRKPMERKLIKRERKPLKRR